MSRHQVILLVLALLTLPLLYFLTPDSRQAPLHSLDGAVLVDFEGAQFRLSSVMTDKKLLLAFWSITCADCVAEIPLLISLHRKYGDRLTIVGLHPPNYPSARIKQFLKRFPHQIPYLLAIDQDRFLTGVYEAQVQPKLVLLDQRGREMWSHVGYKEAQNEAIENSIRERL